MPQSYVCLNYHLVWSTRDREPLITPEIQPRLYAYIGGILREQKGVLHQVGGTADHIHLLASVSREVALSSAVRDIKANSTRFVRATFPDAQSFGWQDGFGAFTVGHSGVERVREYIRNQEEHHRTKSFQEEFVELLNRYGITYDERYLWR